MVKAKGPRAEGRGPKVEGRESKAQPAFVGPRRGKSPGSGSARGAGGARGRFAGFAFCAVGSLGGGAFQLIAQSIVVTAFETADGALAFPGPDEVLEATGPLNGRLAAFRATFVTQHAELVFTLT